jgi:hypothetical protein
VLIRTVPLQRRSVLRASRASFAVPTSQYIHPEFGLFYFASRFRRTLRVALASLLVAGVGAIKMAPADRPESDAAAMRIDPASIVETVPATSLTPFVLLSSNLTVVEGAQPASDKPRCVGDALADLDGNCVSIKLRKPRMVRVATDRGATAAVAVGRTASLPDSNIDPALPAVSAGREGDPEKSGRAASVPSRSRVRLSPPRSRLPRQRRPRGWRIVKTTAATRTGMALRPGARSESTTRDRAARQATTSGARTAQGFGRISGRAGVGAF